MRRQLAQLRPSSTTAQSLYTPGEARQFDIDCVIIANVSGTESVDVSLFHDADGTTFDETTSILWKHTIQPGEVIHYEPLKGISEYRAGSNVGCKVSLSSAATFTVYGELQGERL